MAKLSKRKKAIESLVQVGRVYSISDAVKCLKELPPVKFVQAVDVAINLGVDPRKSDQVVRGSAFLPHGTGKSVRVAVFAQGAQADAAVQAGAERVGFEDLAEAMKAGELNYDVVIAAPDAMRIVGQLGQVLGPRGLMPNPKVGTVTPDVATAVKNAKTGQVRYRTEKTGIVHCSIGKLDFSEVAIKENLEALLGALKKARPVAAKGIYIQKITLSSTMGPGIQVDVSSLTA